MLFRFCLTTHHSRTPASRKFHILICTSVRKYSIRLLPNVSNKKNLKDERKEKRARKSHKLQQTLTKYNSTTLFPPH